MAILTLPENKLVLGPLDVSLLGHLQEYYDIAGFDNAVRGEDHGTVRGFQAQGSGASEDDR